jgi:hypothetical protein
LDPASGRRSQTRERIDGPGERDDAKDDLVRSVAAIDSERDLSRFRVAGKRALRKRKAFSGLVDVDHPAGQSGREPTDAKEQDYGAPVLDPCPVRKDLGAGADVRAPVVERVDRANEHRVTPTEKTFVAVVAVAAGEW